ncbi:MAG: PAS domain S-box protein [Myxococcota bacterium]
MPESLDVWEGLERQRVAVLGNEGIDDFKAVADTAALATDLDVVIVPYHGALSAGRIEELRRRCPRARLVAWLATHEEALLNAAVAEGFDDAVVGRVQLRRRLAATAHEVALLNAVATQSAAHEGLVSFILEIAASTELSRVLRVAVVRLSELFGMDRVSVVLTKSEEQVAFVVMEAERGLLDNIAISLEDYPELQEVMRRREPLVITDTVSDGLLNGVRAKMERANAPPRAALLFPLIRNDAVVGVLFLRSKRPIARVDERLVTMGRLIASVTSVAIGNALEYDSLLSEQQALLRQKARVDEQMADLRQFSDFFEQANDGIVVTDARGAIRYTNATASAVLGSSADEVRGRPFVDLVSPATQPLAEAALRGDSAGDAHGYVDLAIPTADGGHVIISAAMRRLQHPEAVLISFRDVTELREIESELRQTKDFLENLIQSSVDAIIAADPSGRIILFNRAAEQLLGHAAEQVIGHMNVASIYPPGEAVDIMRRLRSDAWGGRGRLTVLRKDLVAASGQVVPVNLSAAIIYEDDREVATVGIYSDMRERLRIEQQLDQVQRQLQLSERQSVAAELAGAAAHELNQPLTSILGYAEILRTRFDEGDPNRRPIDIICDQTERMAAIVRKIGQITAYQTKPYVGDSQIMDLSSASSDEPPTDPEA